MIYYSATATTTRLPSCAYHIHNWQSRFRRNYAAIRAIKVSHQKYSNIVFVVLGYHAIILNLFIIHHKVPKYIHEVTIYKPETSHYGNQPQYSFNLGYNIIDQSVGTAYSKICAFIIYVRATKGTRTIITEISTRFIVANWCCTVALRVQR